MFYGEGSLHVHDGKDDVCYGYGGGMEDIAACMGEAVLKEYGYESEGEFTSKSVTGVVPEVLRMEDKSPSCSSGSGSKRQERKIRPESRPDQLVRPKGVVERKKRVRGFDDRVRLRSMVRVCADWRLGSGALKLRRARKLPNVSDTWAK